MGPDQYAAVALGLGSVVGLVWGLWKNEKESEWCNS